LTPPLLSSLTTKSFRVVPRRRDGTSLFLLTSVFLPAEEIQKSYFGGRVSPLNTISPSPLVHSSAKTSQPDVALSFSSVCEPYPPIPSPRGSKVRIPRQTSSSPPFFESPVSEPFLYFFFLQDRLEFLSTPTPPYAPYEIRHDSPWPPLLFVP